MWIAPPTAPDHSPRSGWDMLGWCPNSETSVISRKVAMAIAAAMNHFRDHPISGQRGRSGARPGKDHPWDGKKSQKEREASYRPINVTGYYDSAGSIMLYPSSSTSWSTFPPFLDNPTAQPMPSRRTPRRCRPRRRGARRGAARRRRATWGNAPW